MVELEIEDEEFDALEMFSEEWHEANRIRIEKWNAERAAEVEKLNAEGITGVLESVAFTQKTEWDNRYPNLSGRVIIDARGRFNYRDLVYTSKLKKIYVKDGRTFAKTHYSTYELIDFNPEIVPEDFRYAYE
jgi:hypothetical protein